MTKRYCDICGKTIGNVTEFYMLSLDRVSLLEHRYDFLGTAKPDPVNISVNMDLCTKCYEDVANYINNKSNDRLYEDEIKEGK